MLNNNYRFENYTTATSDVSTWMLISTYSSHEAEFTIINQGKNNDMTTAIAMEFLLAETATAPATSMPGVIFNTGDSISMNQISPFYIYIRTTSTDASIQYVENAEGGY